MLTRQNWHSSHSIYLKLILNIFSVSRHTWSFTNFFFIYWFFLLLHSTWSILVIWFKWHDREKKTTIDSKKTMIQHIRCILFSCRKGESIEEEPKTICYDNDHVNVSRINCPNIYNHLNHTSLSIKMFFFKFIFLYFVLFISE